MNRLSNKKIALIHVAKTKTGMTEDEYRDMLQSFGADSSKKLNPAVFQDVMKHFEKMGFKSTSHKKNKKAAVQNRPLISKINAILNDLDLPEKYADGMAQRMFGIQTYKWCSPSQLHKLVAALSYYQKRRKA